LKPWVILLIILIILIAALVVLYILGRRLQKKQAEQQEQLEAAQQTVSMLIIDKKRMPFKDAGLPKVVVDAAPKMARRSKVPVVKAKVGPKVMTLIADEKIFDQIPVRKEVKATVAGIYITGVKGLRGGLEKAPEKKSWRAKLASKAQSMMNKANELDETVPAKKSRKKK